MSSRKGATGDLRVWDLEDPPAASDTLTVLWRHSAEGQDTTRISIVAEVESQADELRRRYLAWIHDLSQAPVGGKRVVDHLKLRPGLSYWWMSAPAQKFNLAGDNGIDDTLKLLALESVLGRQRPGTLQLHTENAGLARGLELLCQAFSIDFVWIRPNVAAHRRMLDRLPSRIRAVVYLIWYSARTLRCTAKGRPASIPGQILFMDILVHLEQNARKAGQFQSNYWTALVGRMKAWGLASTWGHLYFRHDVLQTPADASALIESFNQTARSSESHFLLETYFGACVFLAALKDYLYLGQAASRFRSFTPPPLANSRLNPWPLHEAAWEDSLTGREAMLNCLRLALSEKAMRSLPRQQLGVYIAENQPWELAFIHAWRAAGHGKLIGVPHTTVRFWDLRYHYDKRTHADDSVGLSLPQPDVLATNGPLARASLMAGGYPENRLRDVEALRFLHLQTAGQDFHSARDKEQSLCILVCGDFHAGTNARLLAWLHRALNDLPPHARFIIKPHPAFPLNASDFPASRFSISSRPIPELLPECNVVFTSNTTSAAVDAFCAGVPVVQMMDGRGFDASPLRGLEGIQSVLSPDHLAQALLEARAPLRGAENLFNFDPEFQGWRRVLDEFSRPD